MLASAMDTAEWVLANWKLDPFAPVSPVKRFTSVKWEQLFVYVSRFHGTGRWLGSS